MALTAPLTGAWGFIVSEANGNRSRENGTLLDNEIVKAGEILGAVTLGAGSSAAQAGNTGNGTMGAITVGAGAKPGVYRLEIIEPAADAGKFLLEDPDGIQVGTGTVAVAFSTGGIGFTLADGATDFVAGDGFNITVAAGSGKLKKWAAAATDGSAVVAGILGQATDATDGDTAVAYLARDAEVNLLALTYPDGTVATITAGLEALGIQVRP